MIYIEHNSMDPSFWVGLERELLQSDTPADVMREQPFYQIGLDELMTCIL